MTIKLQIHFQANGMLSILLLISVSFKGLLPVNLKFLTEYCSKQNKLSKAYLGAGIVYT